MVVVTRRIEDAFELCMFLVICHEDRNQTFPARCAVRAQPPQPVIIMADSSLAEGDCEETGLTVRRLVHPNLGLGAELNVDNEMIALGIMAKCPVAMLFYIEDAIDRLDLNDEVSVEQCDSVFQIRGIIVTHNQEVRIAVDLPVGFDQDGNPWQLEREGKQD